MWPRPSMSNLAVQPMAIPPATGAHETVKSTLCVFPSSRAMPFWLFHSPTRQYMPWISFGSLGSGLPLAKADDVTAAMVVSASRVFMGVSLPCSRDKAGHTVTNADLARIVACDGGLD